MATDQVPRDIGACSCATRRAKLDSPADTSDPDLEGRSSPEGLSTDGGGDDRKLPKHRALTDSAYGEDTPPSMCEYDLRNALVVRLLASCDMSESREQPVVPDLSASWYDAVRSYADLDNDSAILSTDSLDCAGPDFVAKEGGRPDTPIKYDHEELLRIDTSLHNSVRLSMSIHCSL